MTDRSELKITSLYTDLSRTIAAPLLAKHRYPWEILDFLGDFIREFAEKLQSEEYEHHGGGIYISKYAKIAPTAYIGSPCMICADAEVRHCAFIRGSAIVGRGAVVGNSTELKNCVLFDGVQVPHFNYVGDSVLGYKSHMGAGAVTSNVKSDRTPVYVTVGCEKIETGRRKFGAMLGDFVEIGCGSVLNPGTVIGKNTSVYPMTSVRGYVPEDSIYKAGGTVVKKR